MPTLSAQLVAEFGDGFSLPNLPRMVRFAEVFPDAETVSSLSRQLGRRHLFEVTALKDELKRGYYAEMCRPRAHTAGAGRARGNGDGPQCR